MYIYTFMSIIIHYHFPYSLRCLNFIYILYQIYILFHLLFHCLFQSCIYLLVLYVLPSVCVKNFCDMWHNASHLWPMLHLLKQQSTLNEFCWSFEFDLMVKTNTWSHQLPQQLDLSNEHLCIYIYTNSFSGKVDKDAL